MATDLFKFSRVSFRSILVAGAAAGVCDITAAMLYYGVYMGMGAVRILQSVASGVLGSQAYEGGAFTAALGLLLHFTIATGAAAVYHIASRQLQILIRRAVLFGILYGPVVYVVMAYVVVPSSAIARKPIFNLQLAISGIIIHMFCVGLPIALGNRWAEKHAPAQGEVLTIVPNREPLVSK